MKMIKRLDRVLSVILILLLSFSGSIPVFSASGDATITAVTTDDSSSAIIDGYRMISAPVKITAPTYCVADGKWTTFKNASSISETGGVIYRIDFPNMVGKEFKNFIFRFGTSYYGGGYLRVMRVPSDTDVENMSPDNELFGNIWANESDYIVSAGKPVAYNFNSNFYINYADITVYANECLNMGATHMYLAVDASSTSKAFGSDIIDTDYKAYDLFPYYYYDTKTSSQTNETPTIKGYQEISEPVLVTGTTYGPASPWTTFINSVSISENQGVIYRIDFPKMNGEEFKSFIFRFGTSYYGGNSMRVMGVPASVDVENLSYTDEPFRSMWANEKNYISNVGEILTDNFTANYFINYADVTAYANECLEKGDTYMYLAVDASSTSKAFGSDIKDSTYRGYDLFPYYYYDTKPVTPSTANILSNINSRIAEGKMNHPYIHGSLEKINEIKKNLTEGDYWTTYLYEKVKSSADSIAKGSPVTYGTQVSQSYGGVDTNIITLMTAFHIEDDSKYLESALAQFEALQTITGWTAAAQLDNTQTGEVIAVAYDWLYDYLSDEQKLWAETVVKEKVLSIAYRYYQNPNDLDQIRKENDYMNIVCGRGSYNHNTHNNSDLLVCALALAPKDPEYSAFIISNNLYNIEPYLELVGENGGHQEPIGYYNYTSIRISAMMSALNSALGTMYGYDKYPAFAKTAYYPMQMYGAGAFCFGDTARGKGVFNSNPLYYFAKHSNDIPLLGVLASRFDIGNCVNVLLWYDKGDLDSADINERLPLDAHLYPSTYGQNIAAFRDNWDIDKGFYAAMYTGCASSNGHADAVSGCFCIDAFGERFVTPMGLGDYQYTGYWDHAQDGGRWTWYEKRPEGGNCLVINPSEDVGQKVDETAVFDRFETSDGTSYAVTDLTGVYSDYVTNYKRGMMIHENRSRIVVQDEAVMKAPSEIFWSFNTEAAIEILDNSTVVLTNNGKKVMVKISCNADYSLFRMKAEKLPTSPQSELQRKYPGYSKVAITADNVTNLMLSAEFIPLANDYEWQDGDYEPLAISQWSTEEDYESKPVLDGVYIGGELIEGFEKDKYNYELVYDIIPDKIPEVTVDNSGNYEVNITYPTNGKTEIVISVRGEARTAYYVLNLSQTSSNLETFTTTIDYRNIKTASYDMLDSSSVGTNESRNYLYNGKNFYSHYATIDISGLKDTDVTSAIYRFYTAGVASLSVYGLSGDFTPGTTTYADLPEAEAFLGEISDKTSGRYTDLDITDYIKRLVSEGKTSAGIMIVQNSESTAWIAGTSSSSSYRPKLTVTHREIAEPFVISDIGISTNGDKKSGSVVLVNSSENCFGEYIFYGASYEGSELTDVSMSEPVIIMPYRAIELTAQVKASGNTKFFLWKTNGEPVKVKEN